MILHLLLGLESLFALESIALELETLGHDYIVTVNFSRRFKCAVSNLTRLDKSFYATFVAEVRASQLRELLLT